MIFGGVIGNLLKKIFNEQRKREEAIKEEHKRLHDLFNSLLGLVIVLEEDCKVRFANRNYIMEYGECEGKFCYEVVGKKSPCNNCLTEKVFRNNLPTKSEELFLNNRIYEVTLQPFSDVDGSKLVIKTLYDITERKEAEQELSRLQAEMARLEREFSGTNGGRDSTRNQESNDNCPGISPVAGSQGAEFLSLAKNSPTERQCQNINEILRHLYPLLEADTFTRNKQIVFEAGETPDILLNAKEISQLVLNLCRNGLEAMQVGGTLTIRTYIEDEHVVFSVEDEGCGIHSESLDKLGTPFFTTKENGTGLGLSTCYSIADRHNATIDLKSGSSGTAFFVRFPFNPKTSAMQKRSHF